MPVCCQTHSALRGLRLDQAAVDLGFLAEEDALQAIGDEVGIEYVDLPQADIDFSLLKDSHIFDSFHSIASLLL